MGLLVLMYCISLYIVGMSCNSYFIASTYCFSVAEFLLGILPFFLFTKCVFYLWENIYGCGKDLEDERIVS